MMTRAEIIEKYTDKLPKRDTDNMEGIVNAMIVLYQMKRLQEMGLLEANTDAYVFTEKGFDLVFDILEDGWKMTIQEIGDFVVSADLMSDPEDVEAMAGTLMYLQERGYETVKAEFENFKKEFEKENP